ncbi:hypothetical protein HUG17_2909 [Dermatophagoides farinae]|uniref:Uncharacterized protein n=1 Tax=Dermatophagoides farinae TaxID=6954 RepID=A0A9D4NTS4_DERFA|nr:hypothetical protein HUG17_2909 [Dermatophagoides farinae]
MTIKSVPPLMQQQQQPAPSTKSPPKFQPIVIPKQPQQQPQPQPQQQQLLCKNCRKILTNGDLDTLNDGGTTSDLNQSTIHSFFQPPIRRSRFSRGRRRGYGRRGRGGRRSGRRQTYRRSLYYSTSIKQQRPPPLPRQLRSSISIRRNQQQQQGRRSRRLSSWTMANRLVRDNRQRSLTL